MQMLFDTFGAEYFLKHCGNRRVNSKQANSFPIIILSFIELFYIFAKMFSKSSVEYLLYTYGRGLKLYWHDISGAGCFEIISDM